MASGSGGHDPGTLYVSRAIPSQRVRSEVGRHLAAWCQQRPTWRLSRRRPSLPSYRDYLRKYAANQTAVAGGAHFRRKRRAGRRPRLHRSVNGKNKKGRRRSKKGKKAQTKALRRSKKTAKAKASPRLEFPAAPLPKGRPEESPEDAVTAKSPVVLQEALSPRSSGMRRTARASGITGTSTTTPTGTWTPRRARRPRFALAPSPRRRAAPACGPGSTSPRRSLKTDRSSTGTTLRSTPGGTRRTRVRGATRAAKSIWRAWMASRRRLTTTSLMQLLTS
nr:serine/arginine-rich splicing factor SR45-like [Penaeus vannamei]